MLFYTKCHIITYHCPDIRHYLWQVGIKDEGPKVADAKDADQSSDQRLRDARRQQ